MLPGGVTELELNFIFDKKLDRDMLGEKLKRHSLLAQDNKY